MAVTLRCFSLQDSTQPSVRNRRQEYDEAWAILECQKLMNTTIVNKCEEIGLNMSSFRLDCVADALVIALLVLVF